MDWTEHLEAAQAASGYDELKAKLPITYVVEKVLQQFPEYSEDGRAHVLCPFHADATPSLDIFGEHYDRWGCYPCAVGGDVFDLLRRLEPGLTFPGSVQRVGELLESMREEGWVGREAPAKRTFDLESAARMVGNSTLDLGGLATFLSARGAPFTAEQLHAGWRVGSLGNTVVIPYFDKDGNLATYKHRTLGTKPLAAPGSKFDGLLYGEWRDDPSKPVILCEGETDTWAAAYYLSQQYSVLGLPTGAGTSPDGLVDRFAGRLVVVAFDGDNSGRSAARRWAEALKNKAQVWVVPLPQGSDLWGLGSALPERFAAARPIVAGPPAPLLASTAGYSRLGAKDTLTPLSNWTLDPVRELRDEHGNMAYEGLLCPSGVEATITSSDLSTAARTFAWAAKHGGSWYGTDRDSRTLLAQFQSEGPFLDPAAMSSVAGLVGGQFVYPAGYIGHSVQRYVPLGTDAKLSERVWVQEGQANPAAVISLLRALHTPEVMDPILAWLAAAPLRSTVTEFPILAVTGASGSGKTTLIETVLRLFTGSLITTNLTGTTRYGIEALVASTNAFPVWVDEYRPGARQDTAMAFQQILRDAYTAQGSVRGGSAESWAAVSSTPVIAPIVVTGESAFEETSHLERMVNVNLPKKGRNPDALAAVRALSQEVGGAFAFTYLLWLYRNLDFLPAPRDWPDSRLSPRQAVNLGRVEWGWDILDRFVQEAGGDPLGAPALSLVVDTAIEDASTSPIDDALVHAAGDINGADFVFRRELDKEPYICVQVQDFVRWCKRNDIPLPGNEKAVRRYLLDRFDSQETRISHGGFTKLVIAIKASELLPWSYEPGDVR